MDSKSSIPTYEGEAAPPAYTEAASFVAEKPLPTYQPYEHSSTSKYYSHQIQDQLQSITTQIKSLETQKSLLSHAKDENILSLLTTQIQIYLSDFAKSGLHRGTLVLIPARAIEDENAMPMEYDFKDPNTYDRVVKVRDKEAEEYDEALWFWRDEEMAERLTRYLRPAKDFKNADLPSRKEEEQVNQGTSRWGWKRRSSKAAERPPLVEERKEPKTDDKVLMSVKPEEVVFRTENDFGIYETQRGWGIVLKLRVVLGR